MGAKQSVHHHHHYPPQTSQSQTPKPSSNFPQLLFYLENSHEYLTYDKASDTCYRASNGQRVPRPPSYTIPYILDAFDAHAAQFHCPDASGKTQMRTIAYIPDPVRANTTMPAAQTPTEVPDTFGMPEKPPQYNPAALQASNVLAGTTHNTNHYAQSTPAVATNSGNEYTAYPQAPPNITINTERGATVIMHGLDSLYAAYPQAPPSLVVNAAEDSRILLDYSANTRTPAYPSSTSPAALDFSMVDYKPFEPLASVQALSPGSQRLAIEQALAPQPWRIEPGRTGAEILTQNRETRDTGSQWPARHTSQAARADSALSRRQFGRDCRHRGRHARSPSIDSYESLAWSSDDSIWSSPSSAKSYCPRR